MQRGLHLPVVTDWGVVYPPVNEEIELCTHLSTKRWTSSSSDRDTAWLIRSQAKLMPVTKKSGRVQWEAVMLKQTKVCGVPGCQANS